MLKNHLSVLTAFLAVLMLFFGCVPALPVNIEENSAIIKPGTTYIGTETIYRGVWSSSIGPSYARYEITEDSVIYKFDVYSEEKVFPVEKWEWQEFPYSEEEWKKLFEIPEFYFDIFEYGKIMYQPINEFVSFLLVDGEIWCMDISLINSEDYPELNDEEALAEIEQEEMEQDIFYHATKYDPGNENHVEILREQDGRPFEI